MPEEPQVSTPSKLATGMGLTRPFVGKDLEKDGVDAETGLFHGIDPDTKERVSVTIEGLTAEFGAKEGERKYLAIAGIAGGSIFFNPSAEATTFRPPLGISGLTTPLEELQERLGKEAGQKRFDDNKKYAALVAEILASKE